MSYGVHRYTRDGPLLTLIARGTAVAIMSDNEIVYDKDITPILGCFSGLSLINFDCDVVTS